MADPSRTLQLLWRSVEEPPRRRGPRPALTVDEVVAAAVLLADREGLDALTMRGLAATMGVAPMALYTYVAGKPELLDLMIDSIYAGMPREPWGREGWRTRVTTVALANRALFEAHPWVAQAGRARPPLGPGLIAKYEHELRAFEPAGLDDVERDAALTFVLDFVRASAVAAAAAAAERRSSGQSDEEWWEANGPLLARVLTPDAYPTAARVGAAAGAAQGGAYSPERAWEFGLERVLDGLEALIRRRAGA